MKRILLILILFITTLCFAPPKSDKQQSNLEVFERNYNKVAVASGGLLLTSAALNYSRIMLGLNHYYLSVKPYFNQRNASRSSFVLGSLLAIPVLYIKYRDYEKKTSKQ